MAPNDSLFVFTDEIWRYNKEGLLEASDFCYGSVFFSLFPTFKTYVPNGVINHYFWLLSPEFLRFKHLEIKKNIEVPGNKILKLKIYKQSRKLNKYDLFFLLYLSDFEAELASRKCR